MPCSLVPPEWVYWSTKDFGVLDPDSNKVAALFLISRKKEISIIHKPTPVINAKGKLLGIIGNLYDEKSTPAIVKINSNEVGSCYAVRKFEEISIAYCPTSPLAASSVKDTNWEKATGKITIVAIPTLVSLPFGTETSSTIFDNNFIKGNEKLQRTWILGRNDVQSPRVKRDN